MRTQRCAWVGALVLGSGACSELATQGNLGGAHRNVRHAGNTPGGWALARGDMAIDFAGATYWALRDKVLVKGRTAGGAVQKVLLPGEARRLAFIPNSDHVVVLGETAVTRVDGSGNPLWRTTVDEQFRLDVSPDGARVLAGGRKGAVVLNAQDGTVVATVPTQGSIRDVDFLKDGRVLISAEGATDANDMDILTAQVLVLNGATGEPTCTSQVDACAGEVEVSPDEKQAFLSPTVCQVDPVVVLGLEGGRCEEIQRLPGFGPLAVTPDAKTMVAFLDRDHPADVVPNEVKNSPIRYHLMFINTQTLDYTTAPVGQGLPRFALTPDGKQLLVDFPMDAPLGLWTVNMDNKRAKRVGAPPITLSALSFDPESARAFVVDGQLFTVDLNTRLAKPGKPTAPLLSLNLTPGGSTVLLSEAKDARVVFVDAHTGQTTARE